MRAIILGSALLWAVVVGAGLTIYGCYEEPDDLVSAVAWERQGPEECRRCVDVEFLQNEYCHCGCWR